jgi:transcriptional regulator with XRE-family HTH domain
VEARVTLIQQLRHLRICQGMTQEQLAAKSGYYRNDIVRWENGVYDVKAQPLSDIAQALGYDIVLRAKETMT